MRSIALLFVTLIIATLSASVPARADDNSCTVTIVNGTCEFHCDSPFDETGVYHPNQWIGVSVAGSGVVSGTAECGPYHVACADVDGSCGRSSIVLSAQDGTCTLVAGSSATCRSYNSVTPGP